MNTLDLIQTFYARFGAGDLDGVIALQADDVVWEFVGPSTIPYFDTYRGPEGVRRFFARLVEHERVTGFEPIEFVVQGDVGVVFGRESAVSNRTGKGFESRWVQKFTVRDGKIAHWIEYIDTAAMVAAYSD